jgi:hypothetical protein
MIQALKCPLLIALVASVIFVPAIPAQDKAAPKTEAKAKAEGKKRDTYPFTGKVTNVDKIGKIIMLNGKDGDRHMHVTFTTKLFKAGKPATFEEVVIGEEVTGQARKAEGRQELVSIYLGPRPEGKGEKKKGETK